MARPRIEHAPPEVMLATQQAGPRLDTPERRLLFAVLYDAVRLATGPRPVTPTVESDYCAALRWISSTNADSVFTFEVLCAILNIDADALRTTISRDRAQGKGRSRHNACNTS